MAYSREDLQDVIYDLMEIIQDAIELGHWRVDGSCDPSMVLDRAGDALRAEGFFGEPGGWLY